jgi:hypothetical protein
MTNNSLPLNKDTKELTEKDLFKRLFRLRIIYALALTFIAFILIFSSLLMQYALKSNSGDSRMINLSGRQRMLSQRLTKSMLIIEKDITKAIVQGRQKELETSLKDWMIAHEGLQHGDNKIGLAFHSNSLEVQHLFAEIEGPYQLMLKSALEVQENLKKAIDDPNIEMGPIHKALETMLINEPLFFNKNIMKAASKFFFPKNCKAIVKKS